MHQLHSVLFSGQNGMKFLKALSAFSLILFIVTALYAQRAFREYPSVEYGYQPLPPD